MNTSQKISRVIGELQKFEKTHEDVRSLLRQYTGSGFAIARTTLSATEKWNILEAERRELLQRLCFLCREYGITCPFPIPEPAKGEPDATH